MLNTDELTILIVDDNPQNLQLFGSVLKKNGYKPLLAQNGLNAIEFVQKNEPDLILLDVMMPGINGYDVCSRLKADPHTKHIPIIFITAKTEPDDILHGFEVGGVDYIAKPFNIPELLARVKTHIELKKARDIINHQAVELEKLNHSKDRLFSIIGHDLRNPFSGIMSFSNLLLEDYADFDDEERIDMINTINKSASQGYRLLENLLDWSRSHSGFIEFKKEELDVADGIATCIDLLTPFASQKNLQLKTSFEEGIKVLADGEMFMTIIRNLLSNAIKFTASGGVVLVKAELKTNEIVVHVQDTGVGIPEDAQSKILSLGEKYTSKGTEREVGTGLGLMLVQEFMAHHGGRIWFESEEGVGSTFSVAFPNALNP